MGFCLASKSNSPINKTCTELDSRWQTSRSMQVLFGDSDYHRKSLPEFFERDDRRPLNVFVGL